MFIGPGEESPFPGEGGKILVCRIPTGDSNSKQHKGIVAELGTGQWAHPTTVATIWHCFKGPAIVDSRMTANTASKLLFEPEGTNVFVF